MAGRLASCMIAVVASMAVATDCSDGICLLQTSVSLIKPDKTEPASAKVQIISDSESTNAALRGDSQSSEDISKTSVSSKAKKTDGRADGDGTPNKMVVALLEVLGLGFLGIDRIYLGCFEANHLNIWLGVVKLLTLGGCGIWCIIDWFAIMINAMTYQATIDFLGMSFTWEEGTIHSAYVVALVGLILMGVSCCCYCLCCCCTSALAILGVVAQPKYTYRKYTPEEMMEQFKQIDKDGDGFISQADLRKMDVSLSTMTDEQAAKLATEVGDTDGDGKVSYEEFCEKYKNMTVAVAV